LARITATVRRLITTFGARETLRLLTALAEDAQRSDASLRISKAAIRAELE